MLVKSILFSLTIVTGATFMINWSGQLWGGDRRPKKSEDYSELMFRKPAFFFSSVVARRIMQCD